MGCVFILACSPVRELRLVDSHKGTVTVIALGPRQVEGGIFLAFVPDIPAQSIAVVGTWNNWNPRANFLTNAPGKTHWSGFIPIEKTGIIKFCYFINGQKRQADPLTETEADDEGQEYSVFTLSGK